MLVDECHIHTRSYFSLVVLIRLKSTSDSSLQYPTSSILRFRFFIDSSCLSHNEYYVIIYYREGSLSGIVEYIGKLENLLHIDSLR